MSNVKLFDVQHSNDECQNELNVKLFDVDIRMTNQIKESDLQHSYHFDIHLSNVEHQTV